MANSDVLVRMKADTQNYDANIAKARRQLDQFKKDNLSLGGVMKTTSSQLLSMATQFASVAAAIGAATKVAKDFFNSNEAAVDEWGRTMEAAKGIYEGFLTSLNTGDFGGFLSRINDIVEAARKAYDELDRLGTLKTIQTPEMSRQMTENERNRMMIQTRRYIAPLNGEGAIPGMKNGQLLTDAQIKTIEADLQTGIERIIQLVTNEVSQTTNAIEAIYNTQAQKLGMTIEEFKKGTSSMAEFDKMLDLAKKYDEYEKEHTYTPKATSPYAVVKPVRDETVNPYAQYKNWDVFRVDGDQFRELVSLIQQRDQQTSQVYSSQMQAYRAINRAEGISVRGGGATTAKKGSTSTGSEFAVFGSLGDWEQQAASVREYMKAATSTEEYKELEQELDFIIEKMNELKGVTEVTFTPGSLNDLTQQLREAQDVLANMSPESEEWANALESVREKMVAVAALQDQINQSDAASTAATDAKNMTGAWQMAASAIATAGSAMQMIEDPAAKVAGIIAQAIAQVALGAGQAIAFASNGSAGGPWGWLAFAISATATMISTIAAIKSATSAGNFANGGVIGGNSYSGDNLIAHVNSGETILSAAQSDVIASKLTAGNGGGGGMSQPYLTGDVIILGMNNYLGRSGQGEIVTTSMLRRAGIRI